MPRRSQQEAEVSISQILFLTVSISRQEEFISRTSTQSSTVTSVQSFICIYTQFRSSPESKAGSCLEHSFHLLYSHAGLLQENATSRLVRCCFLRWCQDPITLIWFQDFLHICAQITTRTPQTSLVEKMPRSIKTVLDKRWAMIWSQA